jgi:hypothetical protein
MSLRYWICGLGYTLSFVLGFVAIMVACFGPSAIRIPAGAAIFMFGWGGRVFLERLNAEFASIESRH